MKRKLTYREAMWSIKGQMPAEAILGQQAYINTGLQVSTASTVRPGADA